MTPVDRIELYQFWSLVAETYSGRYISKLDDKFRAFSALVKEFQNISGDYYLAGVWQTPHLYNDLLWKSVGHGTGHPKTYVAPSWSWLSSHYSVSLRVGDAKMDISQVDILAIDIQLKDPKEPFGGVTRGKLHLRGMLESVSMCNFGEWYLQKDEVTCAVQGQLPVVGDVQNERNHSSWPIAYLDDGYDENGKTWRGAERGSKAKAWALPVVNNPLRATVQQGLILVSTGREGEYKRIGTYEQWRNLDGDLPWLEGVDAIDLAII